MGCGASTVTYIQIPEGNNGAFAVVPLATPNSTLPNHSVAAPSNGQPPQDKPLYISGRFAKPSPTRWAKDERKAHVDALLFADDYNVEYRIQGRQISVASLRRMRPILGNLGRFDPTKGPRLVVAALVRCRCTRDALPLLGALKETYPALTVVVLLSAAEAGVAQLLVKQVPTDQGLVYAIDDEDVVFAETVLVPAMQPESGLPKAFLLDDDGIVQWHGHPEETKSLVKVVSKLLDEEEKEVTFDVDSYELHQKAMVPNVLPQIVQDGTAAEEFKHVDVGIDEAEMINLVQNARKVLTRGESHSIKDMDAMLWHACTSWTGGFDPEFPPSQRGLSHDPYVFVDQSVWSGITWQQARSHGFMQSGMDTRNLLFVNQFNGQVNFQQGRIGNCYFCAALAAVSMCCPWIIEEAFRSNLDLQGTNHVYGTLVYVAGQRQAVVVDDFLPQLQREPAFTTSTVPELWPMVLEKSFVKSIGTYDALKSGNSSAAMEFITGAPSQTISIKDVTKNNMGEALWRFLRNVVGTNPVCAGSSSTANSKSNIVPRHAYTVCFVDEDEDQENRIVGLRNPWGGRHDRISPKSKLRPKLGRQTLSFEVFSRNFDLLYVNLPFHAQAEPIIHLSVAARVPYGNNVVSLRIEREGRCSFGFHQDIEVKPGYNKERLGFVYMTLLKRSEGDEDEIVDHSHSFIDCSDGLKGDCRGYLHTTCSPGSYYLITKNFRYCYEVNPKLKMRTRLTCYGTAGVVGYRNLDAEDIEAMPLRTRHLCTNDREFSCQTCTEYANVFGLCTQPKPPASGNSVKCAIFNESHEEILYISYGGKGKRVFGYGIKPLSVYHTHIDAPGEYAILHPSARKLIKVVQIEEQAKTTEKGEKTNTAVQKITNADLHSKDSKNWSS